MENCQAGSQPDAEMICRQGNNAALYAGIIGFIFIISLSFTGRAASWETLGGWETDTNAEGFGFVSAGMNAPISPGWTFLAYLTGSNLYYHYTDNVGYHDIGSPGLGATIGLRRYWKGLSLTLAGGGERRWTTDTLTIPGQTTQQFYFEDGALVQGALRASFASVWVTDLMVNYSGANHYYYSRGDILREVISREGPVPLSIGVEAIGHGNENIVTGQGGVILETRITPLGTTFSIRSGYKKVWVPAADVQEGPYFGLSFYKGFN